MLRLRLPDLRLLRGGESLLPLLLRGLPEGDMLGNLLLLTRPVVALDTDRLDALLLLRTVELPEGDWLRLLKSGLPLAAATFLTCPFSCSRFSALPSCLPSAPFFSPFGSAPDALTAVVGVSIDATPLSSCEAPFCCSGAPDGVPPSPAGFAFSAGVFFPEAEPLP